MQIHISPRDVKLTPAIHTYVAQKIEGLEHFGLNLIGAHVALWHDDKRAFKHAFVVKVHLPCVGLIFMPRTTGMSFTRRLTS